MNVVVCLSLAPPMMEIIAVVPDECKVADEFVFADLEAI